MQILNNTEIIDSRTGNYIKPPYSHPSFLVQKVHPIIWLKQIIQQKVFNSLGNDVKSLI